MKLLLVTCLLGVAAAYPFYVAGPDVHVALSMIKGILSTDYGFQQVKGYIKNLKSQDPFASDIRSTVQHYSDEELKKVLHDFFAKVPDIAIEPLEGFEYPTLAQLFGTIKAAVATDEGVANARIYLENLNSPNLILQVMTIELLELNDIELKHFFAVLLSDIQDVFYSDNYDVKSDLQDTMALIKGILVKPEGIQQVRDHLKGLSTTNPTLILAKTVLSAMSDKSLIDLVKEIGKNIKDVDVGSPQPDLLGLVLKAKDLAATKEGVKYLREYLDNLQTSNFLIIRVKNFVKTMGDDELIKALNEGSNELFGPSYSLEYALYEYAEGLRDVLAQIKHQLKSELGFQTLKSYLINLKAKNMYVQIGKQFFVQMDDSMSKGIVRELLKDIPDIEIEEGTQLPSLGQLFSKVKVQLLTAEGVEKFRVYASGLETDNMIVQRLKAALISVDDQTLTDILVDIFQGV